MSDRIEQGTVTRASGGPSLYFRSLIPAAPKAVLAIVHGYADHSGRYEHVMEALATREIATVAIDMRGHGKSEGARGFCERFEEYLTDVGELHKLVATRAKGVPSFLFGHSFGGLVSSHVMLSAPREFRGLLLSGPYFGLALQVSSTKVFAGKLASRLVPKFGLPSGLRGQDVTHDAVRARAYDEDPLVFKNANVRWFTEAQRAQMQAFEQASQLKAPLWEAIGTADPVASFSAAKRFFDGVGSSDKTFVPKEGLFHEILNEPSYQATCTEMADWVLARA